MKNIKNEIDTITYFFRKKDLDYSIERVFKSIIPIISLNIRTKSVHVPNFKIRPLMILRNLIFCRHNRTRINHITGVIHYCSLVLPYSKTIITIHDMISVEEGKGLRKFFFWFFFFYLPIKRCKYVTCISQSVRETLIKYKTCPRSKIVLIPNPVSDIFRYSPKVFNKECPRILHIGTRPNKNLPNVIRSLCDIPCLLIIIGDLNKFDLDLLNQFNIEYINKFHLSDNEIYNEYINCDIVSFPSIFEGFGLPIIEGQAIGRPVLTSNILPMNHVVGENYFTINPFNINDIRTGFLTIINKIEIRDQMVESGLINVEKYRTDVIASKYLDLYNKVLDN